MNQLLRKWWRRFKKWMERQRNIAKYGKEAAELADKLEMEFIQAYTAVTIFYLQNKDLLEDEISYDLLVSRMDHEFRASPDPAEIESAKTPFQVFKAQTNKNWKASHKLIEQMNEIRLRKKAEVQAQQPQTPPAVERPRRPSPYCVNPDDLNPEDA